MARVKLKVAYVDGREIEILASPRAQVMTERQFGGFADTTKVDASYYLAWASLNTSGQESADYETWLNLITEVDEVEGEEPRPTPAAQPAASSSD
jgi:hypothetical protein